MNGTSHSAMLTAMTAMFVPKNGATAFQTVRTVIVTNMSAEAI